MKEQTNSNHNSSPENVRTFKRTSEGTLGIEVYNAEDLRREVEHLTTYMNGC